VQKLHFDQQAQWEWRKKVCEIFALLGLIFISKRNLTEMCKLYNPFIFNDFLFKKEIE